jgi:hypothetical protein
MSLFWYLWTMATKKAPAKKVHRKPDEERREDLIKVLVTSTERATLQGAADAAGMTVSTWLRYVGLKAAKGSG